MIGVICNKSEREIAHEFFQLFKTPWEFYQEDQAYDVIISTTKNTPHSSANLLILYSTDRIDIDSCPQKRFPASHQPFLLESKGVQLPIYGPIRIFTSTGNSPLKLRSTGDPVAITATGPVDNILRVGYDLFKEVSLLLSTGQPVETAHIPTLEIHISLLRNWIIEALVPLVEIPPLPAGYDFIASLTHDVDFIRLRKHKFDHTFFGFIYRALVQTSIDFLKSKISWKKLVENWWALLKLPGIYYGITKDYFDQFDHYLEIEKDIPSTFFLIPRKNYSGQTDNGSAPSKRACRYDVNDFIPQIKYLQSNRREIAVHGIDAWTDYHKAEQERLKISQITAEKDIGIRMHWLYFGRQSPEILDKAGFYYDSTCGYNETVGFRAGTAQVFRPLNVEKLLRLPLHIQDTALFYPDRMRLTEKEALILVDQIARNVCEHGGVLTVNWHNRSLGPERLWARCYKEFLKNISCYRVWFATAMDIVRWFSKRRNVKFVGVTNRGPYMEVEIDGYVPDEGPPLILRYYTPKKPSAEGHETSNHGYNLQDFELTSNTRFALSP